MTLETIAFQYKDMTYLIGTADNINCNLEDVRGCDDDELATYCQAMLQGENRVDRMFKWMTYLGRIYGHEVHRLVQAQGVPHNFFTMLNSREGKCVVFGICPFLDN